MSPNNGSRKPSTRKMSDAHEIFLAELFDAKRMRGSGNQFNNQMDVRGSIRDDPWAFAVDGKSTFGESIGVSLGMWEKAVEQSHDERTALALRWYSTYRLDVAQDLVVVDAVTFAEMLKELRGSDS